MPGRRPAPAWQAIAASVLAAVVGGACGQPPAYDPAKVLNDSAKAMAAVQTVSADVAFGQGAKAFGLTLDSGHGAFRRPAASDTTVKTRRGDTVLEFEVVTIGASTYLRVPLIGWEDITNRPEVSGLPDFRRLLDNDRGLPAVLPLGTSPVAQGHETIDGHDCYRLTAGYTGDQVAQVITVLQPTGPVTATLWVDASTSVLRRIRLAGPIYGGAASTLEVRLRDFGANPVISKPPV